MSTQKRLQSNSVLGLRGIGQGFGLPCPSKFQSGHLPSAKIPVSRAIHVSGNDSKSGSDMDTDSDSDGEVYGVKYPVNSLPKDEKIPNSLHRNSADKIHSKFRLARDAIQQKKGNRVETLGDGGVRSRVAGSGYTVEESLDSVISSEVSSRLLSSSSAGVPKRYSLEGDHSGHLQPNMETVAKQVLIFNLFLTVLNWYY